jgi:hypothetical protein
MTITDKRKDWDAFAAQLKAMGGDPHVLVGVQGAAASVEHASTDDKPVTNADVASWNEFGTRHIPARSFIRATIDIYEQRFQKIAAKLGAGCVQGTFTVEQALGLLGEEVRGKMIERINARIDPPNAPSTIARKGSSTPLIAHTGALKNSLTTKVVT